MTTLRNHPDRQALNDEIHARPPELLTAPSRISFLALYADRAGLERQREQVGALANRFGVAPPLAGISHFSADLGGFRLKWERHTEFCRYKFIVRGAETHPFAEPALGAVDPDWLAGLSGEITVATHVSFIAGADGADDLEMLSTRYFDGNMLVGGGVAGGAATAVTDFRIHNDGFSRILVRDHSTNVRQAGRIVQRLLEVDAYRVMALLALPVARELSNGLNRAEHELAAITASLVNAREEDEGPLLDRLTRLEAEIESRYTDNLFRFGASAAYYDLVKRRIAELRETRVKGVQTIEEFMGRRLTPAMKTCEAVAARQESLSQRVARASQLLSTRVEITRENQSHAVLESMNRRAKLQLRLQETVEGLSVAAATYYIAAIVGHLAEGLRASGAPVDPALVEAAGIPIIAALTWLGIRRIRRAVMRGD